MEMHRCPGCMGLTDQAVCPTCGWEEGRNNEPHQLKVGTVLHDQFVVGRALGQGGFGITYLGWDRELERIVAIKEFYPSSTVNRDTDATNFVNVNTQSMEQRYADSRERFLREAKALAKLTEIPGIVGIYTSFQENNTAYIIMEYVRGVNLAKYIEIAGGHLSVEETLRILKPIISALETVHKEGLVHRDISPDNIMLHPMGGAKLLDFGAVRAIEGNDPDGRSSRSTEAIVKHGFAPIEQYRSRGSIGPWTDEYALCATVYYCLTGQIPPDAPARSAGEEQLNWAAIPGLTDSQRAALERGMSIAAKDRFPGVGELARVLYDGEEIPTVKPVVGDAPQPDPKPVNRTDSGKKKKLSAMTIGIVAAAVALVAVGALCAVLLTSGKKPADSPPETELSYGTVEVETAGGSEAPLIIGEGEGSVFTGTFVMAKAEGLSKVSTSEWRDQPFWGQEKYTRKQVRAVSFLDSQEGAPATAWDVSAAKDGGILAWLDTGTLYVAGKGTIALNPDSSWMFAGFSNLETVDFGKSLDTSGVTDMRRMFDECTSLKTVNVSCFDTSKVTNMYGMFRNCTSLASVDVSGFKTSEVLDMGWMFCGCSSLTALDVSGFDTGCVTSMRGLFYNCSAVKKLDVSGFDTISVTDMRTMFYGCSSLTTLDVSGFDTGSVTDMNGLFYNCSSLKELDLTGFDTSHVTDMGNMFRGCASLTYLDLRNFDTSSLTNYRAMFRGCIYLGQLDCSDSRISTTYRNNR